MSLDLVKRQTRLVLNQESLYVSSAPSSFRKSDASGSWSPSVRLVSEEDIMKLEPKETLSAACGAFECRETYELYDFINSGFFS